MPELSWEELVAEIEGAIESGRFADAQRFLEIGERHHGASPQAAELRRRLLEIERLARPPDAHRLLQHAEARIQSADYAEALKSLRQAAQIVPRDGEIRRLLEQTEKAAARQQQAVERNRAVEVAAQEIAKLIDQGELSAARRRLQAIGGEHAGHRVLTSLRQRLAALENQHQQQLSEERLTHARALLESANWHGAAQEAERILRATPENQAAREIYHQARAHIDEEMRARQLQNEIEETRQDVERLIKARALSQASQRLDQAVRTFGEKEEFTRLALEIDKAHSDVRFRQRIEWAERRSNEARRLIDEASNLSLRGEYATAIERLRSAKELDPSHPEIEGKIVLATEALDRQLQDRQRNESLRHREEQIRGALDAMLLDQAARTLALAQREFGDQEERLRPLARRLERLRETERTTAEVAHLKAEDLPAAAQARILEKQRLLRRAYPWHKTLLFPFRGAGPMLFGAGLVTAMVLDILAALPQGGTIFAVLRGLLLVFFLGCFPAIIRLSAAGQNQLSEPGDLFDFEEWPQDLGHFLAIAGVALLPLLLWLATRGLHGSLEVDRGPWGWWVFALLLWPACASIVVFNGARDLFGASWWNQPARHWRALGTTPTDSLVIVDLLFLGCAVLFLLRFALIPHLWAAALLASVVEIYGLLVIPHMVGVWGRRRRLELARVYGTAISG